ncbi:hypothetical protein NECAME_05911 [Necator americanus]|uniref:Uncharacterized protein n=1 Tax=Necator americanus TaxID=51031 RepID=W2TZZ0_NECAM|nr:hypothetical protein NECAME_05911 [Necator americanus]ETN86607.1 hypothetical protein NECAME_05911 [Necator americanus]
MDSTPVLPKIPSFYVSEEKVFLGKEHRSSRKPLERLRYVEALCACGQQGQIVGTIRKIVYNTDISYFFTAGRDQ